MKNIFNNILKFVCWIIFFYLCTSINKRNMIIIPVKEGEHIDRALKKFKRKFEKTGIMKELRARKAFQKPSIRRRKEVLNAIYVQKLHQTEEK